MLGTNTTLEVTEPGCSPSRPLTSRGILSEIPSLSCPVEKRFSGAIVRSEETKDESRHLSCEQGWEEDTTLWQEL